MSDVQSLQALPSSNGGTKKFKRQLTVSLDAPLEEAMVPTKTPVQSSRVVGAVLDPSFARRPSCFDSYEGFLGLRDALTPAKAMLRWTSTYLSACSGMGERNK